MSVSSFPFWIALLGCICESCIHCSIINQVSLLKLNHDFLIGSQSWYKTTQVHRGILLTLKLKSNGKIPSFSFVFLALTLFLPSFTLLLFYLRRLHLSCSVCLLSLLPCSLSLLSISLSRSRSFSLALSFCTFRGLWWCAKGKDTLQQKGQRSDSAVRWQPGSTW